MRKTLEQNLKEKLLLLMKMTKIKRWQVQIMLR